MVVGRRVLIAEGEEGVGGEERRHRSSISERMWKGCGLCGNCAGVGKPEGG